MKALAIAKDPRKQSLLLGRLEFDRLPKTDTLVYFVLTLSCHNMYIYNSTRISFLVAVDINHERKLLSLV